MFVLNIKRTKSPDTKGVFSTLSLTFPLKVMLTLLYGNLFLIRTAAFTLNRNFGSEKYYHHDDEIRKIISCGDCSSCVYFILKL